MPVLLLPHMRDQIIHMQALHDEDNDVGGFIIESGIQGVVIPGIHRLAFGFGEGLLGF